MSIAKVLKSKDPNAARQLIEDPTFNPNEVDLKTSDSVVHTIVKNQRNELLKALFEKYGQSEDKKPNLDLKDQEGRVAYFKLDSSSFGNNSRTGG